MEQLAPAQLDEAAHLAHERTRTLNRLNAMSPASCRVMARMMLTKLRTAPTVDAAAEWLFAASNHEVSMLGDKFKPDLHGLRRMAASIPERLELRRRATR